MPNRTILDTVEPLPTLRELRSDDCELFREWMNAHHNELSDITFTNLYVWRHSHPVKIARHGGFLIVVRFDESNTPRPYPPVGEGDLADTVRALFKFIESEFPQVPRAIVRAPEGMAVALREAGFQVEEDRDNFDYVYQVSDLAELRGRKFHGKRNLIFRCLEANICSYEPVTAENVDDCLAFEEEWCRIRRCDEHPELAAESRAIKDALQNLDSLGLFSGAIRIDERIKAFAVGERLDSETAVVHFEKADQRLDGLYQVINQWFCQKALSDFAWVNREQDLGIEGLRRAKMSYRPHHFVKKFTIRESS